VDRRSARRGGAFRRPGLVVLPAARHPRGRGGWLAAALAGGIANGTG
jgi:hypothetical protein